MRLAQVLKTPVSRDMLGRVFNGSGKPIDGGWAPLSHSPLCVSTMSPQSKLGGTALTRPARPRKGGCQPCSKADAVLSSRMAVLLCHK